MTRLADRLRARRKGWQKEEAQEAPAVTEEKKAKKIRSD